MIGMYKYIFLLFLLFIGSQNAAVSSLCGLLLGQKPCSIGTKTLFYWDKNLVDNSFFWYWDKNLVVRT